MIQLRSKLLIVFAGGLIILTAFIPTPAQSTDANFPTSVQTNEINGTIRARDIGDARLTRYFYTFDGGQGDIFINVVTNNFSGDIDVFAAEGLRPLTKMVIYADGGRNETGRLIYLRKGERLILRIEGRSPNDDPAEFRIKFGGSFIALSGGGSESAPTVSGLSRNAESSVSVNSVGTIIEVKPTPQPVPPETTTKALPEPSPKAIAAVTKKKAAPYPAPAKTKPAARDRRSDDGVATVFGKKPAKNKPKDEKAVPPSTEPAKPADIPAKEETAAVPKTEVPARTVEVPKRKETAVKPVPAPPTPKPDPLASIRLVVELKNGGVIERPMSEVAKFSVDNGVLVVIGKDGKTVRYSILDVAKVTIE